MAEFQVEEVCTARGCAYEFEFFDVRGGLVSRGHNTVEHNRVHNVGRVEEEAFPHCARCHLMDDGGVQVLISFIGRASSSISLRASA